MDLSQLPKFDNTRGRFIRVSDLAEFRGWVAGERNLRFVLQLEGLQELSVGEELVAEIYLMEWSLKLRSKIVQVSQRAEGEPATIVVMDTMTMTAQHGSGKERFRVNDLFATVSTRTARLGGDCPVLDISLEGLGILLPEEPRLGTMLKVNISPGDEQFTFETEVRYSQKADGGYRTGLLIRHHDRITERKWRKFLTDLNERTAIAA